MRVAAIAPPGERERIYRVTVKPVTGEVSSAESGLKLLVGYDLLVLVRPAAVRPDIVSSRVGGRLVITNRGNSSVELAEGKQCGEDGKDWPLAGKRLYAGASWEQPLPRPGAAEYRVRTAEGWSSMKF